MRDVYPLADGSVLVEGAATIRDLNESLSWSLPDQEATTIAGLLIHGAAAIPDVGQTFSFHGFRFTVMGKARNRITMVKVFPCDYRGGSGHCGFVCSRASTLDDVEMEARDDADPGAPIQSADDPAGFS